MSASNTKVIQSSQPQTGQFSVGHVILPLVGIALSVGLWWISLAEINIRQMNHLGLISVFPPLTFFGMVLANISFVLTLRQSGTPNWVRWLHVVVIVVMLHGITALVEDLPRFAINYLHVGFSDHISRTGSLATDFDARFSWPGFFALIAFGMDILRLDIRDMFPALMWAHVIFNLFYAVIIWLVAQAFFEDERPVWFVVWLFVITNWIGQDYFAPQAIGFLFYMAVIMILIRWHKGMVRPHDDVVTTLQSNLESYPGWLRNVLRIVFRFSLTRFVFKLLTTPDPPSASTTPAQRIGLLAAIVIIFAALVSSHQLTPFFLLATLLGWIAFNRVERMWYMPILLGVMVTGWVIFMTVDYLTGNISELVGEVGAVSDSVAANVDERLVDSTPEREMVIQSRLVMSLSIWGLAGLACLRRLAFNRKIDWTPLIAAGAPFPIVLLQSYGGEMVLRVYFFSLPFMAMLIARHFPFNQRRTSWISLLSLAVLFNAFTGLFLLARHGNEIMDYVTLEEFEVVDYTYDIAPPGSMLVTFSPSMAYRHRGATVYELVEYDALFETSAQLYEEAVQAEESGIMAFVLLTRGAAAAEELLSGLPPGWGETVRDDIRRDDRFVVLYETRDAQLSVLESSLYWETEDAYTR